MMPLEDLKVLLGHDAPDLLASLRPGASQSALAGLMDAVGPLPADLRQAWMLHDGQSTEDGFLGGYGWSSVGQSMSDWAQLCAHEPTWRHGWLPIAGRDANYYCVVITPDSDWSTGTVLSFDHDGSSVRRIASSFAEWLERIRREFSAGETGYSHGLGISDLWTAESRSGAPGVVAASLDIEPEEAEEILDVLAMAALDLLEDGEEVVWPGLGRLQVDADGARFLPTSAGSEAWIDVSADAFGLDAEEARAAAKLAGEWCRRRLTDLGKASLPRFARLQLADDGIVVCCSD
jgi:cell wall assembly regulator SMI1